MSGESTILVVDDDPGVLAGKLGTAEKTIKVHRARVMHEMAVRSVSELTRIAELMGIPPEP
jgi:FixJ family two-component response regulator